MSIITPEQVYSAKYAKTHKGAASKFAKTQEGAAPIRAGSPLVTGYGPRNVIVETRQRFHNLFKSHKKTARASGNVK